MPVKMTGAQFKAWLASDWGPDAMWEESEVLRNSEPVPDAWDSDPTLYADGDVVILVAGTIIPDQQASASEAEYIDAVKHAKKWPRQRVQVNGLV